MFKNSHFLSTSSWNDFIIHSFPGLNMCLNLFCVFKNSSTGSFFAGLYVMCYLPSTTSYKGQKHVSAANFEIVANSSGGYPHPLGQGDNTETKVGPFV